MRARKTPPPPPSPRAREVDTNSTAHPDLGRRLALVNREPSRAIQRVAIPRTIDAQSLPHISGSLQPRTFPEPPHHLTPTSRDERVAVRREVYCAGYDESARLGRDVPVALAERRGIAFAELVTVDGGRRRDEQRGERK